MVNHEERGGEGQQTGDEDGLLLAPKRRPICGALRQSADPRYTLSGIRQFQGNLIGRRGLRLPFALLMN